MREKIQTYLACMYINIFVMLNILVSDAFALDFDVCKQFFASSESELGLGSLTFFHLC
jgi:hypothetical protein